MDDASLAVPAPRRLAIDPVVVGIAVVLVAHAAIRIFGTDNFSVDDTESTINTQVFQLFYALRNPPLFDWLYFGFARVFGVSEVTLLILKTLLLGGAATFLYLGARPLFRQPRLLTAAMLGYGVTGFYGWDVYQQFTHTIAFIFALGFTLWALMRVLRRGATADYLLLGLAFGLGTLSKYLYLIDFAALAVAALRQPAYRPRLFTWKMGWGVIVALAVISPLLVGLGVYLGDAASAVADHVVASPGPGRLLGVGAFLVASAMFWLPLAAILWACLAWRRPKPETAEAAPPLANGDFYHLLRDATLLMVAFAVVSILAFNTDITKPRYLVPMLSFLPLAIFAAIDRREIRPAAVDQFIKVAAGVIAGVAIVRFLIFLFVAPPFCVPKCRVFRDYAPLVERLTDAGGKQTVILTEDVHLGSNLLRLVPNSRVLMGAYRGGAGLGLAPPEARLCYFVWLRDSRDRHNVSLRAALQKAIERKPTKAELQQFGPPEFVTSGWQTKLLAASDPDNVFGVVSLDSAIPLCGSVASTVPDWDHPSPDNSSDDNGE